MNYFITTFQVIINGESTVGKTGDKTTDKTPNPNRLKEKIIAHYRKDYPLPNTVAVHIVKSDLVSQDIYNQQESSLIF
ncbi:MAG: hypothetical protein ACKOXB_14775 [Flavobacteriales bacterium]